MPLAPSPSTVVDEMAAHNGNVCPERLPQGYDPDGHGFGSDDPATATPGIPAADAAWVCLYNPEGAPHPSGDGTTYTWVRDGGPRALPDQGLPDLTAMIDRLVPFSLSGNEYCTADLGARWVLVTSSQGDLTGVVMDDYGCRHIRLTDEPFETARGDAEPVGTVPGVLEDPPGDLLREVKIAFRR